LVWSRTFILGVGLTDLGDLERHLGGNKAIVGVFNGPVIHVDVGIALIILARAAVPGYPSKRLLPAMIF
jgi:hypothetical protein